MILQLRVSRRRNDVSFTIIYDVQGKYGRTLCATNRSP